jgi:hypothetical protein
MLDPYDQILVTLDVDWAPDFVIDYVSGLLIEKKVKSTWFITHDSPAIERLRQCPELFELGIHPNFKPGSTHGDNPQEVIAHCLSLAPKAKSLRTHSLFQSTPILDLIIKETPCTYDVSLFLPHTPCLRPVVYVRDVGRLIRIPYIWEDDFETSQSKPIWQIEPLLAIGQGLKVINFHPIHVYLNSKNLENYASLLQSGGNYADLTEDLASLYVNPEVGTRTMFFETLDFLSSQKRSCHISEIRA